MKGDNTATVLMVIHEIKYMNQDKSTHRETIDYKHVQDTVYKGVTVNFHKTCVYNIKQTK